MPFGEHSRGCLPHVDQPQLCQSITFRLADAVPAKIVATEMNLDMRFNAARRATEFIPVGEPWPLFEYHVGRSAHEHSQLPDQGSPAPERAYINAEDGHESFQRPPVPAHERHAAQA
ncbi:MAG: hypothetical protein AAB263_08790 [Planctomycetota bacterium]